MAGVARRLAEAEAALATLDEAVPLAAHSLLERDSAILRLIYTFEAMWKACQHLLAEREDIEVASANSTIRMYRGKIGEEIGQRLAGHAALLRRWLDAMREGGGG